MFDLEAALTFNPDPLVSAMVGEPERVPARQRKTIAIAAPEGVLGSAIAGPFDLLSSVGVLWQEINQEATDGPAFDVRIAAEKPGAAPCYNGLAVIADVAYRDLPDPDIVLLPTVFHPVLLEEKFDLPACWESTIDWVSIAAKNGATVCGYSAGVVMMAAAGLLNGSPATTHWTMVERATQWFPNVDFRPQETLLPLGQDAKLITAGGGTCWQDLALYLIARFVNPVAAAHTAKTFTIFRKTAGQLPFAQFRPGRAHQDAPILKAQEAISTDYPTGDTAGAARAAAGLTDRTFKRRFKAATGLAPGDYIRHTRIQEARYRLETTSISIEDISATVGYADVAFFRTLFKRIVGMTPGLYRDQFGLLDYPGLHPLEGVSAHNDLSVS